MRGGSADMYHNFRGRVIAAGQLLINETDGRIMNNQHRGKISQFNLVLLLIPGECRWRLQKSVSFHK